MAEYLAEQHNMKEAPANSSIVLDGPVVLTFYYCCCGWVGLWLGWGKYFQLACLVLFLCEPLQIESIEQSCAAGLSVSCIDFMRMLRHISPRSEISSFSQEPSRAKLHQSLQCLSGQGCNGGSPRIGLFIKVVDRQHSPRDPQRGPTHIC